MEEEYINCNLCGSKNYSLYKSVRSHARTGRTHWDIVQCDRCQLIYLNPRLTLPSVAKLYASDYNTPDNPNRLHRLINFLKQWRVHFSRNILAKQGDRVLDVGCGDGHFLLSAKRRGCKVYGLDLDARLAKHIQSNYGIEVFVGELSGLDGMETPFDHLCLFHSLEHTYNPAQDLAVANRLLKPGGKLHIEVPNSDSFEMTWRFFKDTSSWDPPYHTYHFSKRSLYAFLEKTGFKVLNVKYPIFTPYIYSSALIKLIKYDIRPELHALLLLPLSLLIFPFTYFTSLFGKTSLLYVEAEKATELFPCKKR